MMRKTGMLAIAIAMLMVSSCKKEKALDISTGNVSDVVVDGTWRVTSYIDEGTNETSNYAGYTFTFAGNGTIAVSGNNNAVAGTWNVKRDNDDNNEIKLEIDFAGNQSLFNQIEDDWYVLDLTKNKITLRDDDSNSNDDSHETLIFERN